MCRYRQEKKRMGSLQTQTLTDPIDLWDGVNGDLVRVRMETGRN